MGPFEMQLVNHNFWKQTVNISSTLWEKSNGKTGQLRTKTKQKNKRDGVMGWGWSTGQDVGWTRQHHTNGNVIIIHLYRTAWYTQDNLILVLQAIIMGNGLCTRFTHWKSCKPRLSSTAWFSAFPICMAFTRVVQLHTKWWWLFPCVRRFWENDRQFSPCLCFLSFSSSFIL